MYFIYYEMHSGIPPAYTCLEYIFFNVLPWVEFDMQQKRPIGINLEATTLGISKTSTT